MHNIFILYMPPTNAEASIHYHDTIINKVEQRILEKYLSNSEQLKIRRLFGENPVAVWGSQDGPQNRSRFEKMQPGDEIMIVKGDQIMLLGKVALKTINSQLSQELWKDIHGQKVSQPWKLIYFIANPLEVNLPFAKFKKLFDYKENWALRGFTSISEDKLSTFYNTYDDLYDILFRMKNNQDFKPISIQKANKISESTASYITDESDIREHLQIQWHLLQLGLNIGSNVWIPKNDQSQINKQYNYDKFDTEFSSGIDIDVKYVANIDVVWKDQYRIDAAFEIENSTSIYSGLLRFSDLKIVAPNSVYPLYIVAPNRRKNSVIKQANRPTFIDKHFNEEVRFLSYEAVQELHNSKTPPTTQDVNAQSESLSLNH